MSIKVCCKGCAKSYVVKDHFSGKLIRCPHCKTNTPIPEAVASDTRASSPERDKPAPVDEGSKQRSANRVKLVKRLLWIAASVVGVVLACCVATGIWFDASKRNALVYNRKLVDAQLRLVRIRISRRTEAVKHEIDSIRIDMSRWQVPWGARGLHRQYREYLDNADQELLKFGQVAAINDDETLTPEQKLEKTRPILEEIDAVEKTQSERLLKEQKNFARFYHILLLPGRDPLPQQIRIFPEINQFQKGGR